MIVFIIILFLVFYIPYKLISSLGNYFGQSPKKETIHYHTYITNNSITIIDPDTKAEIKRMIK